MKQQLIGGLIVLFVISISCRQEQQAAVVVDEHWGEDSATRDIKDVQTILPQDGYVELVESSCTPCHSLRYIEMQPELTRKAWEKIVDKMVHSYGAPVRDSVSQQHIVDYLYSLRGKEG